MHKSQKSKVSARGGSASGGESLKLNPKFKKCRRHSKFLPFDFCLLNLREQGFTLLETIVALGVILSAIVGPFTLAMGGIVNAAVSKNKLTAINLAEEGVELVRKIRDDNVLRGRPWDTSITAGDHQIDVLNNELTPYDDRPLLYDNTLGSPTYGLYQLETGGRNPYGPLFKRKVIIEKPPVNPTAGIPLGDQMRVKSEVCWTERVLEKCTNVQEILYNWR